MLDQISPTIHQLVNGDTSSYLTGSYMNSMVVNETDPAEIVRLAGSLKNSYSIGSDGIPTTIVKSTINEICESLTFIINLSLIQGKFPDPLKTAKSSISTSLTTSYQSLVIGPYPYYHLFSKICERPTYNRLLDYLNKNDIICHNQYGF